MNREYSSFRDPSGIVFEEHAVIFRQINTVYKAHYDYLMNSGLYEALSNSNFLVRHRSVIREGISDDKYLIIKPEKIPFISYPYEWSFDEYKDATLTVLQISEIALQHGMILKDASAYNIQFVNGHPLLIDTLSFEIYKDGYPWIAYGQFCRHFLAPLLLMAYVDVHLSKLMLNYMDGIPLDLATKILQRKGGLTAWLHIKLHSRSIAKYEQSDAKIVKSATMSKSHHIAMLQSMTRSIEKIKMHNTKSEWVDYYDIGFNNYNENSFYNKEIWVIHFFKMIGHVPLTWDFGANDGRFSRIAKQSSDYVVAFDIDPLAVNRNYIFAKGNKTSILPLLLDITNPSPSIGFANMERKSITQRQRPDVIMMLALIHHLFISHNLPFEMIAQWISSLLCTYLIIEFVPKEDSQVLKMMSRSMKEDVITNYDADEFEAAFIHYFTICEKQKIDNSLRVLYLFKRKNSEEMKIEEIV